MNLPINNTSKTQGHTQPILYNTVIVPRVRWVLPVIGSLGRNGNYICKSDGRSGSVSVNGCAIDVIHGQTLMASKEKWFKTIFGALPLVEQSVCVDFRQRKALVANGKKSPYSPLLVAKKKRHKEKIITHVRGNACSR